MTPFKKLASVGCLIDWPISINGALPFRLLRIVLWVVPLVFAYTTITHAWDARLIVPYWDRWDFLASYRDATGNGVTFASLWTPHNGHRLLIPRLLFLTLDELLNGKPGVLTLACQLLQAGLIAVIVVTLKREPELRGTTAQSMLVAASIVLLTWAAQMENFYSGLQIAFVLPTFLAVAALALLSGRPPGARFDWPAAAATVTALIACLCLGAGLAIGPALLVMALVQRRGTQAIAIIAGGVALSAVLYLGVGTGVANLMRALAAPWNTIVFLCRLLGPPFAQDGHKLMFGAVLIGLGALALGIALVRGVPVRIGRLGVGLVAFGLLATLLIAITRTDGGHVPSRYVAFSSLYWTGLLLLIGPLVLARPWRPARWAVYGAFLAGTFTAASTQTAAAQPFVDRADQATAAVLSMVAGTPDEEAIAQHLYPRPEVPLRLLPFLMKREYGFFGDRLVRAVGHPVTDVFRIARDTCEVTVGLERGPYWIRVSGHFEGEGRPPWLLIVDRAGQIRGLAARKRLRNQITGYAPVEAAGGTLYGIQEDTLCFAASLRAPW